MLWYVMLWYVIMCYVRERGWTALDRQRTIQHRPKSPTVALTWHGSKYKVNKLEPTFILNVCISDNTLCEHHFQFMSVTTINPHLTLTEIKYGCCSFLPRELFCFLFWGTPHENGEKLAAKSSVVPQRPSRLRDRWWWWWWDDDENAQKVGL